jgi:hypothetical protein
MDDLFEIAHSDALGQMKNEEDKNFLMLQRQKGRPGSMVGVHQKLKHKEERALKRTAMEAPRKKGLMKKWNNNLLLISLLHQKLMIQHQAAKAVMVVKTLKIPLSSFSKYQQQQQPQQQQQFQQLEVQCSFLLPVSEVSDRCKITDRNGVYKLMAAAEAFGRDTENLVINRTSFQRLRKKFREARQENSAQI